jgi:diguanylate cyclase (GGDEF)-like protein
MTDLATADALLAAAEASRERGDVADARVRAADLLARAALSTPERRARAAYLLVESIYRGGDSAGLVAEQARWMPPLREAGRPEWLLDALRWLAMALCDMNRFDDALATAHEAVARAQQVGSVAQRSLALNCLGSCVERLGDPWQGERLLEEAVALAESDPQAGFAALVAANNLCAVLIGKHYLLRDAVPAEQALAPLQRALPHARRACARASGQTVALQVITEGNLGEVLVHLGDLAQGARHLRNAMAGAQRGGLDAVTLRVGCSLGEWALASGLPEEAWSSLTDLLPLAGDLAALPSRVRLHHALALAGRATGRHAEALAHLERAHRLERSRAVQQLAAQSRLFVTRVEAEQARHEAMRQRERAAELEADVRRDGLTGLGNRREVDARLPDLVQQAAARGAGLALAMLDLDHFKLVNDRFGHPVGDATLQALAQILRDSTRDGDLVARTGGEEFLVALPGVDPAQALEICERLRAAVQAYPWGSVRAGLALTVSVGVAHAPAYDLTDLLHRADDALYQAKHAGRNRVVQDAGSGWPAPSAGEGQ